MIWEVFGSLLSPARVSQIHSPSRSVRILSPLSQLLPLDSCSANQCHEAQEARLVRAFHIMSPSPGDQRATEVWVQRLHQFCHPGIAGKHDLNNGPTPLLAANKPYLKDAFSGGSQTFQLV